INISKGTNGFGDGYTNKNLPSGATSFTWSPDSLTQQGEAPANNQVYQWRIWAFNSAGGDYSAEPHPTVQPFSCEEAPPEVQAPAAPQNLGFAGTIGCLEGQPQVPFKWDAASGATSYWLDVTNAATWASNFLHMKLEGNASTAFTWDKNSPLIDATNPQNFVTPQNGVSYMWRVFASNDSGKNSGPANGPFFTKEGCGVQPECVPPTVPPTLRSPADEAEVSLGTANWSWTDAAGYEPNSPLEGFWIDFDDATDGDTSFTTGRVSKFVGLSASVNYSSLYSGAGGITLIQGHTYAWRVFAQVCSKPAAGIHSNTRAFTAYPDDSFGFGTPAIPTGLRYDNLGCIDSKEVTITFIWKSAPLAEGYHVQVSTLSDPAARWAQGNFVDSGVVGVNVGSNEVAYSAEWDSGKTHWWRVISHRSVLLVELDSDPAYPSGDFALFNQDCSPPGDLGVAISIRDPNVKLINPPSAPAAELQKVVTRSIDAGWNPAAVVDVWKNESAYSTDGYGIMGCLDGSSSTLDSQLTCFFKTHSDKTDFAQWIAWHCGPNAVPICSNAHPLPDGSKPANKPYPGRIIYTYDGFVPSGNYGAKRGTLADPWECWYQINNIVWGPDQCYPGPFIPPTAGGL
ncbi:MAG TPA: hypothetical protein VIH52_04135, partial [Candidatus Nanoarchaeia archaeon]